MKKVLYVLTNDPRERIELVSSVIAQGITALSFGYESDVFLMDKAVEMARKGYIEGLSSVSFSPLHELLGSYLELEGKVYVCAPSAKARNLDPADCIHGITEFVDAARLIVQSKDATVFTY